jgi:S-adenosylmethionine hydrolase
LPDVPIVDLDHSVPAHDVRAGSLALGRAAPYLACGIVIAVVDPGVGTGRRGVAVQVGATGSAAGATALSTITFVGPDNGLLMPAVDALGGPRAAVQLEDLGYWRQAPGPTFAGRDIFAPAATLLAEGGGLPALGPYIGTETLMRLAPPICRHVSNGSLEVEVTWVDRFGNVQLAAGPSFLEKAPTVLVRTAQRTTMAGTEARTAGSPTGWSARVVRTYGELEPGELGLLVDSYGSLTICMYGASAAKRTETAERDVLLLTPSGPD